MTFCNLILRKPGYSSPCTSKYPDQRYSQVNLAPLRKFGTIEFRGHSATYDIERILRWTQFLIAFVDHFGFGIGAHSILDAYTKSYADKDYHMLQQDQEKATFSELFKELAGRVDPGTMAYYKTRSWENSDSTCTYPQTPRMRVLTECVPGGPESTNFVHAKLIEPDGHKFRMKIRLPVLTDHQVGYNAQNKHTVAYSSVLMPEGYTWRMKVFYEHISTNRNEPRQASFVYDNMKLEHSSDDNSVFKFTYDPETITKNFSEAVLQHHHRCCCVGRNCLWYSETHLHNNHCPALMENQGMCVSRKSCNKITKFMNPGCVKTTHSRRRVGPTLCPLIKDRSSFYSGAICRGK